MPRRSAGAATLTRPAGLARGSGAYAAAWGGAAMIALLTGASGVVILLAIGAVAAAAAALSGPLAVRRSQVTGVETATAATTGDELRWVLHADTHLPVHATVRVRGRVVASGWVRTGSTTLAGTAPSRGVYDRAEVRWSTPGRLGLWWWRRSRGFTITPLSVAPAAADRPAPARPAPDDADGPALVGHRAGHDDVDGVRQWRDGDEVNAVHWPSTLRAGEFVVRQRTRDRDERWIVEARTGTADPDEEAARVRRALDDCMSRGAIGSVSTDGGEPVVLTGSAEVVRWCAAFDPVDHPTARPSIWRRSVFTGDGPEPDTSLEPRARWAVAAAAAMPMAMLLQPLGYGPLHVAAVFAALAFGALVTIRTRGDRRLLRQLAGLLAGVAMALVLVDLGAITGVMTAMRYLMPQLLVALCVVQGFECSDRRGARVSLACSGLLTAYATGVRVDPWLGASMAAAVLLLGIAGQAVTAADRRPPPRADRPAGERRTRRGLAARGAAVGVAAAAVVGLLAVVPVPRGPAQLTLPAWLSDRRDVPLSGGLATPDASPLLGGPLQGDGSRSGAGAGGYPGFSEVMDTSLRGDLGDEVVMRVRAPEAAFWRGQTFSTFDGRSWTVDPEVGEATDGPDHRIGPADGDLPFAGEPDFIQTFYVEVDMPNILFAADRPMRVLLDAVVWARPDGALRADVVLPAGSAYTVVSHRPAATAEGLRAEGDLSVLPVPAKYLQLPESTTERTRRLAAELEAGSPSTFDTILAIQAWLADHVEYDLDAPVPGDGDDAVDHFLFESQRGFCEQIATATAVLLRSLGVPARIATGYVPSDRDEVAGVWISRARDAHAWVEVWFPSYGWVPFDPTASVPFAGEAETHTIGAEMVQALIGLATDHIGAIIGWAVALTVVMIVVRLVRAWWQRRRRGRWGVLQDRFVAAAVTRGAGAHAPNAELAEVFATADAAEVARALDECAFSPSWSDDEDRFERMAAAVALLERER